ncbi:class I adenylate-forming enzyme family protein [Cupriavidus numazuensis]|uniref:Long-chain-fatty-acid--CoA ligase n=1 Tax=Cupriavidus numazuensis TaxID=221992 RepID=A0ABM8TUG5_9BURK|nr:AMP-binding protein [Cupriavidus numazuensis]CAG2160131.1 Long-chain-fatty-acid--CoA ligase [Cupriavidus numazuensis]
MRISDYFDAVAALHPGLPALIEDDLTLDFAAAQTFVHAAAHALQNDPGLRPGAHIALYAPNDYRVPLLLLAINRADMVWLSAHTRNPVGVNIDVLGRMDCEFIFFHSAYEHLVPQLKQGLNGVRRFICIDRVSEHGPALDAWMAGHWQPFHAGPEDPAAACFLQPTGGTTGPSKAAVHTHRAMEISVLGGIAAYRVDTATRYLAVAPLTHAGGIAALHAMLGGGAVVVMNLTDPAEIFEQIERHGITNLFVPPTLMYSLMAHPRAATTDFRSLKVLLTGAAPVAPEKYREAVRLFGPVVCEGYAQTETLFPLVVKTPQDYLLPDGSFDEAVLRSAGRAARHARVEIMDGEGNLLPAGERGEIVVQTSMAMQGYYRNPAETEAISRHGWRHTGDVGVKDARGYITIVDRLKDMIVSGGFNVYPAQVEAVIAGHDAVLDCVVVGVPDDKWGEAVKAVIQLKPGRSVSADEIAALCRDRLGGVHAPKSVEFWDDLPRSAVGKLLRREVRAKFWTTQWRAI